VSSTKDITIEDHDINTCGSVEITKVGSDGGSQEGAEFTLYEGGDTTGDVVGTCTVDAAGDCVNDDGTTEFPPSFASLNPGTYTIDETVVPDGYGKDLSLPDVIEIEAGESFVVEYTDPALEGALIINKNSTKGEGTDPVLNDGAEFSIVGPDPATDSITAIDNGTNDDDDATGVVCVSGLLPGDYTINEEAAPEGYGGASQSDLSATVVNGTNCTDNLPGTGATVTFTNPPLSDIQVNFRDGGSEETSAVITCDDATGTASTTPATGWDTSKTVIGVEAPVTITCEIVIDP
jgi:uncharacterized surface anchored protein